MFYIPFHICFTYLNNWCSKHDRSSRQSPASGHAAEIYPHLPLCALSTSAPLRPTILQDFQAQVKANWIRLEVSRKHGPNSVISRTFSSMPLPHERLGRLGISTSAASQAQLVAMIHLKRSGGSSLCPSISLAGPPPSMSSKIYLSLLRTGIARWRS